MQSVWRIRARGRGGDHHRSGPRVRANEAEPAAETTAQQPGRVLPDPWRVGRCGRTRPSASGESPSMQKWQFASDELDGPSGNSIRRTTTFALSFT